MKFFSVFVTVFALSVIGCKGSKETNANQINSPYITDSVVSVVESYDKEMKLEGTKWELVQLNGKTIQSSPEKELVIEFQTDGRFSAFMGCNGLGGSYEVKEGNRINFSKVISTMMACPNMETENEFKQLVESIDNYTIFKNKLSLNKAKMVPIAVLIKI